MNRTLQNQPVFLLLLNCILLSCPIIHTATTSKISLTPSEQEERTRTSLKKMRRGNQDIQDTTQQEEEDLKSITPEEYAAFKQEQKITAARKLIDRQIERNKRKILEQTSDQELNTMLQAMKDSLSKYQVAQEIETLLLSRAQNALFAQRKLQRSAQASPLSPSVSPTRRTLTFSPEPPLIVPPRMQTPVERIATPTAEQLAADPALLEQLLEAEFDF